MKTLVVTLNHNQRELTDNLVNQLKREDTTKFGMWVVDNGSEKMEISKYTAIQLDDNTFFGGGFNHVLKKFLNMKDYDYLWFLNNDMIFNGNNIVNKMQSIATSGYDLLSPSITTSEIRQCFWKQMWCWNTGETRDVKWIDFQAPMMSKRLAKEIVQFPQKLHMGWGLDFYSSIVCERNGWNVGVTDKINIVHLDSRTLKDGKVDGWNIDSYSQKADKNMREYFMHSDMWDEYERFRKWGIKYTI